MSVSDILRAVMTSYSRKFQPLATSTPNGKQTAGVAPSCSDGHEAEQCAKSETRREVNCSTNRRILSSGAGLSKDEKLLLFRICNGNSVT